MCLWVVIKYVEMVCEYFVVKGVYVDLIKLYGLMEFVLLVGLVDVIVDFVSLGGMLKVNNLVEVEEIMVILLCFVVN